MFYLHENGDISQDNSGMELTDEQTNSIIAAKSEGKLVSYENGEIVFTEPKNNEPPEENRELTDEQIISRNKSMQAMFTAEASQQISILQDAFDLDMAEDGDEAKLKAWKKYRILLNRVDISDEAVKLPKKPN